jgi:hypothetical protein
MRHLPEGFKICRVKVQQGKQRATFVAWVKLLGKKSGNANKIGAMYKYSGFVKRSIGWKKPIAYLAAVFESGEQRTMRYLPSQHIMQEIDGIMACYVVVRGFHAYGVLADSVEELPEKEAERFRLFKEM